MKYDKGTGQVYIYAEELCVLALHRGDLVSFFERRQADREAARLCASALDERFTFDEAIEGRISVGDIEVRLSGRADVYAETESGLVVGFGRMASAREFNRAPSEEYTAYTKCCAYLACERESASAVAIRVLSRRAENGEQAMAENLYPRETLRRFVEGLLSRIRGRLSLLVGHETRIRPSAENVVFPYGDIRDGQDELIRRGFSVIKQGKRLFAQAPTGIGKTISTLYPAVRSFGRGMCDKIFYLTAKTATAREAYNAAGRLYAAGAHLRTVMLSAKEQMCCAGAGCAGKQCNPRECAFLRGYYDHVDGAIEELLARQNGYYADIIMEVAVKHGICPYELSLDLSELCDIIICDYNYLFDPVVYLRRYFTRPGDFGQYVFLIDEAHNLVDRARSMYSVTFSHRDIEALREQVSAEELDLVAALAPMETAFASLRELCRDTLHTDAAGNEVGYYISRNRVDSFCDAVTVLAEKLTAWLRAHRDHGLYDTVKDFLTAMRKYICILDYYDDKFMTYVELSSGDVAITLNCIDPSEILDGCLRKGRASILFSATLTPISYFSDLLGGGRDAVCLELPSPYAPENLCLAAVDTVSTRFEDRDGNCKKIATLIAAAVSPHAGNYIVYFPSYGYLQKVHEAFSKKYPKVRTVVQSRGMTRAQREQFIDTFREDENKMRIGFCVLGGSFSEGVDLPGSRLIGTIIVGVGLPGFSSERNIMRDYFENRYENGFEYAYTFPGMNSVLQAAGRVIRRETDRGIVVLIDDRYGTPTYQKLFPPHWKHLKYAGNSASLAEITRKFWEKP